MCCVLHLCLFFSTLQCHNSLHVSLHVSRLQSTGQDERAAAVALFNNKLKLAIEILSPTTKGSNPPSGGGRTLITQSQCYTMSAQH